MSNNRTETPIEFMRRAVRALGNCNESFLEQYSVDELRAIVRAWDACGWDFPPDRWSKNQVRKAIRGRVPKFREDNAGNIVAARGVS